MPVAVDVPRRAPQCALKDARLDQDAGVRRLKSYLERGWLIKLRARRHRGVCRRGEVDVAGRETQESGPRYVPHIAEHTCAIGGPRAYKAVSSCNELAGATGSFL
jgi:hypothetical protein